MARKLLTSEAKQNVSNYLLVITVETPFYTYMPLDLMIHKGNPSILITKSGVIGASSRKP